MVLADLGRRINNAVNEYTSRTPKFDEKALDAVLKEIAMALLQVRRQEQLGRKGNATDLVLIGVLYTGRCQCQARREPAK